MTDKNVDGPQDVEWESFESFYIDGGQLDGRTPQQCFVLGVEWQQIATLLQNPEIGFEKPVHTSNIARLSKMLRKRDRVFNFMAYCKDDAWRWLKVLPAQT